MKLNAARKSISSINISNIKKTFLNTFSKMKFKLEPVSMFKILKWSAIIMTVWPIEVNAKKSLINAQQFLWSFHILNHSLILIPILMSLNKNLLNFNSWLELIAIIEILSIVLICKLQKQRLRVLLRYCKDHIYSYKHDVPIFNDSWTTYIVIYLCIVIFMIIVMIIHILYPLISSSSPLPTSALYPFPLSPLTIKILYLHQVVSLMHVPVIIVVDGMLLMMIIIPMTKLERLKIILEQAESYSELLNCIRRHQKIVWFISEANQVISYIIMKTVISLAGYFFAGSLQILNKSKSSSTLEILKFLTILIIAIIRIYLLALCAETMTMNDSDLSFAVYSSSWHKQSRKLIKAKSIFISKCQKPLKISVSGVIPCLNMSYLTHFLHLMVSYIMALRTITGK